MFTKAIIIGRKAFVHVKNNHISRDLSRSIKVHHQDTGTEMIVTDEQ